MTTPLTTPHERAVVNAGKTTDRLGNLFDRLGHSESRRGVFRAYRTTLAALDAEMSVWAFDDAMAGLRRTVELETDALLADALELGTTAGVYDADLYGLVTDSAMDRDIGVPVDALASVMTAFDAQAASARALLLLGEDIASIVGDASRAGVLTPAPVAGDAARWIVALSATVYDIVVQRSIVRTELPSYLQPEGARAVNATAPALFDGRYEGYDFNQFGIGAKVRDVLSEWGRQAVAVIDERTTDCCLRVHGQWQAYGDQFKLTGTPRYADEMDAPPFHKWCRTATALVQRQFAADDLTGRMRDAAKAELIARTKKPRRKVITPANAFSRRA